MIRPLFASEKLLAGPPYFGCGLSADFFGQMLATDNESGLNKWARQVGQGGRRATLQRGWRAFEQQIPPDSNGWVDQGDIELIRRAMWGADCEQPFIGRIPLSEAWSLIGDYAVSAAIDTSAVPASNAIRRYVGGVPHQVVWWKKKTVAGKRMVKHMCPMHPPSNNYTGHWVRWADATKCAKAINGAQGEVFVILYPIGDWTAEQQLREKKNRQIAAVKDNLATVTMQRDAVVEALRECEENCGPCDEQLDAQRDAILERFSSLIEDIRQE